MRRPSLKTLLPVAVTLAVAVPAAAHAAHERADEMHREAELSRLTASLTPFASGNAGTRVVSLNGGVIGFKISTESRPIDDVMAAVADECKSGKLDVALNGAMKSTSDNAAGPEIELDHIDTQTAAGGDVRASLCTFATSNADVTGGKGDLPRVRYTLAHRIDASTTRIVSIVNAASTPLEVMFPAEGDAPGSDLPGVARPAESRRTLTAIVDGNVHEVRMYETAMPIAESMKSYGNAMGTLGWQETATLPEARMFGKDGASVIASFLATDAGTTISLAPFEPGEKQHYSTGEK